MIELRDVNHRFGARTVLSGLSVHIAERRVGIVGANGSGKSTFVRLLNGLQVPLEGSVHVDGLDTRTHSVAIRRRVGFVFQNPDNQIVMPTVSEDLAFGLKGLKLPREVVASRIETVLARYGLLAFRDHPAHLLSGGQKQLLAIAGVLVMEPAYLVLDEPTTLLDLRNTRRVVGLLRSLPQTVIMVTHDLDLLADFDRVLVFDGGRLVEDGLPGEAIGRYRALIEAAP